MSEKRYVVRLTEEERSRLSGLVNSNKRVARKKRMRAQVLLKIDEGEHGPSWIDKKAADAFDVHVNTVHVIRKQLVLQGFEQALERKKRAEPARKPIFDPKSEKEVITLATSESPDGFARWTLRLLANEVVRLEIVESVCHETVRQVLKKGIYSLTAR